MVFVQATDAAASHGGNPPVPISITCPVCGRAAAKDTGAVNRSRASGAPLYCSRACAGVGRRKGKTVEQKKASKRAYDAQRRIEMADQIREMKASYYQRTHDREKEAAYRKANMGRHVEYCRGAEYRAWKREYDRAYRAKQEFGEFWECALLVLDIRNTALELAGGDYEIRLANGTYGKSQQRRRAYERLDREEPEDGPLGDLERHQRR